VIQAISYNAMQILFIMVFAPLYSGVLSRFKENIQSRRGPSIIQPYRDIWKLFHKDQILSEETTWIFRFTPYLVFVIPIYVAILIPVLTDFPLAFAFMGDMLAGGFFLGLAGFFAALAAVDTGNPYGPMGASRTRMVGFLAEPVFMTVFFTVSFVAQSTIPYIVQQKWIASPGAFFSPAHILLLFAFLMLILAEGGKIPVDNPASHFELAMIDESKGLEFSGRDAALMKWGGQMKFLVLTCIFLNVLVAPWGLAHGQSLSGVVVAVPLILFKVLLFTIVLVVIETSLAKLRLFRISEFLGAAFITAVAAMVTSIFPGACSAFAMVATRQVQGVVRYFVIQSSLLAASCFLLGYSRSSRHLWTLGAITLAAKVIAIPWILRRLLPKDFYERREIVQAINIPASLLVSLLLTIVSEFLVGPLIAANTDPVIRINLPIGLAGVLIGAYSLIARSEAIPQLIGILAMENGAFFAGIAIANELPLIAELGVAVGVMLIVVVVGLLSRNIRQALGTTEASALSELKEEATPWR
jgi:formate hydrogenlyase subunit 4/hydrogenase-4 membrane subunit HyfE